MIIYKETLALFQTCSPRTLYSAYFWKPQQQIWCWGVVSVLNLALKGFIPFKGADADNFCICWIENPQGALRVGKGLLLAVNILLWKLLWKRKASFITAELYRFVPWNYHIDGRLTQGTFLEDATGVGASLPYIAIKKYQKLLWF